jgi:hypothetical protein
MSRNAGLSSLLSSGIASSTGALRELTTFDLLEGTSLPDLIRLGAYEHIARLLHGAYLRHELARRDGPGVSPKAIPWEHLSEEDKEGNRLFAADISRKLRLIGGGIVPETDWASPPLSLTPGEVGLLAKDEHERWMQATRDGGMKLGRQRTESQHHPYLRPWEELPPEIQETDHVLVRSIPTILAQAGFRVCRIPSLAPDREA